MNTDLVNKIILLADDDPDDAEMFSLVLAEIDPDVKFVHVKNGVGVFDHLNEHKTDLPNIIFLDINMPEMSGWQCLSSLKNDPLTRQIPVLIYSTSSHPRDRQIAADLGASAFITKPSDLKALRKMLAAVATNLNSDIRDLTKSL